VLVFAKALDVVQLQLWLWDVVPFEVSCARFVPCEFELCDIVSVTVSSYDMGGLCVGGCIFGKLARSRGHVVVQPMFSL